MQRAAGVYKIADSDGYLQPLDLPTFGTTALDEGGGAAVLFASVTL